jgi:hypothetical protein
MSEKPERLTGHPSDYGSRTLADEERQRTERGEVDRTADGDPLMDSGIADSAISRDQRSDDLQGDTDFDKTNADSAQLLQSQQPTSTTHLEEQ